MVTYFGQLAATVGVRMQLQEIRFFLYSGKNEFVVFVKKLFPENSHRIFVAIDEFFLKPISIIRYTDINTLYSGVPDYGVQ